MAERKPTVRDCDGCRDDFYNGNNDLGVKRCWGLDSAVFVKRIPIHVDQRPPYHRQPERMPDCYKRARYVMVSPDALTAEGYWK